MSDAQILTVESGQGGLALRRVNAAKLTGDTAGAVYAVSTGDPATFSDGVGGRILRSALAVIAVKQAGSGDPSPSNIREILPVTGATLHVYQPSDPDGGTEYSVTFPTEAGTVYGGEIDFAKGTLVIDHAYMSFGGTENWNMFYDGDNRYYSLRVGIAGDVVNDSGVCSHFAPAEVMSTNTAIGQRIWNTTSINTARILIRPGISGVTDLSGFKSWLGTQAQNGTPVQLAYKLTNPITYTFDHVFVTIWDGANVVEADCGSVTVEYAQNTAEAIAAGDAGVSSMLADNAPGGIAGRNFTAGEFLTVGTTLYKVTANIANGGTIEPGENVTGTTIGEQLAAVWAALNT